MQPAYNERLSRWSQVHPISMSLRLGITNSHRGTSSNAGIIAVHVFIDESGSFTGFHAGSISVVGTLAIPDAKLDFLKKKYAKIRALTPS